MTSGRLGRHARLFSFFGVLLVTSGLVVLLFQEARAIDVVVSPPSSFSSGAASGSIPVTIVIPENERLPIESVLLVIEETATGEPKTVPIARPAEATCATPIPTGCTSATLTDVTGTAITGLTFMGTTPDLSASGYGYDSCPGAGCFVSFDGYGYDATLGFGYTGTPGDGYITDAASGYGYGSGELTLSFVVTIAPSQLGTGHFWLTFVVETGSGIIGEIQSPAAYFRVAGGGGGGSGTPVSGPGDGTVPTVEAPATTTTTTAPDGAPVATASAPIVTTGAATVAIDLGDTAAATGVGTDTGVTLETLTLDVGEAVAGVTATVTVSTSQAAVAGAAGSVPDGFVGGVFLDITIAGAPPGAVQGGTLTFTMTPAQLAGKDPATVTFLHFVNGAWVSVPIAVGPIVPGQPVTFTATLASFSPFAVAFDEARPTVTDILPAEGATTGPQPTIGATYADNRGVNSSATRLSVDGQPVPALATATGVTFTPAVALTEGLHTATVQVTDDSGLTSSRTWTFRVGAQAPLASVTPVSPAPDSTITATQPLIEARITGLADLTMLRVTLDGVEVPGATVSGSSVRFTPAAPLAAGPHTVLVDVADATGQQASALWSFTVQPQQAPPTAAVPPPAGGFDLLPWVVLAAVAVAVAVGVLRWRKII